MNPCIFCHFLRPTLANDLDVLNTTDSDRASPMPDMLRSIVIVRFVEFEVATVTLDPFIQCADIIDVSDEMERLVGCRKCVHFA